MLILYQASSFMKATFYLFGYLPSRVGKGILAPLTFYCGSHSSWLTPFSGPIEFPIQRKWKCFIFNTAAHNERLSYYTESCNFLPLFQLLLRAEISKCIFYDLFIAGFRDDSEQGISPSCYLLHRKGLSVLYLLITQKKDPAFYWCPSFLQTDIFLKSKKKITWQKSQIEYRAFLNFFFYLSCTLRLQWWEKTPNVILTRARPWYWALHLCYFTQLLQQPQGNNN